MAGNGDDSTETAGHHGGLLGVSALARVLGMTKSTISKHAAAGKIPVARRDEKGRPLFDAAAVQAARGENLNPLMRRTAVPIGEDEVDESAERRSSRASRSSGLVEEQRREKELKNRRLWRQVAEDEGLVVMRSVVEEEQTTLARRTRDGVTGQMTDKASALYAFIGQQPRTEAELRIWLQNHTAQAFDETARAMSAEDDDEFAEDDIGGSEQPIDAHAGASS